MKKEEGVKRNEEIKRVKRGIEEGEMTKENRVERGIRRRR